MTQRRRTEQQRSCAHTLHATVLKNSFVPSLKGSLAPVTMTGKHKTGKHKQENTAGILQLMLQITFLDYTRWDTLTTANNLCFHLGRPVAHCDHLRMWARNAVCTCCIKIHMAR